MGHTAHANIAEAGLADDCPRCSEHAENPIRTLDDGNLRSLVRLALEPDRLAKVRSENEAVAAAAVLTTLERAGRLFEVAPLEVGGYLERRWRVRLARLAELLRERERRVDV